MDLKQLRYFVQVVEAGGFSQASARINLTQSSLSRQVGLLERELGQRLLVRTGRGVDLTSAGATVLHNAREMLAIAERTREELGDLHSSPTGHVMVGLPPRVAHVLSATLVEKFRKKFPKAVITVSESLSYHLRELLMTSRIDLALMFDPPASAQLTCEVLATDSLVLLAPPGHRPLPPRVSLRALAGYPLVMASSPNATRLLLDSVVKPRRIALNIVSELNSTRGLISLVASGVACSILPETAVAADIARHGLQTARIGPPAIRSRLVLAGTSASTPTRLVRGTADLLRSLKYSDLSKGADK
jgi:LysR family nitrogen assimilation transcriptional regulator